jgi:hypothetical protein
MGSKFFGNKQDNKLNKGKSQNSSARTNHKRRNSGIRKTGRGK